MGTRNLTIVKSDGVTRVAQYGQFDGYLTGEGKKVAEFIQKKLKTVKNKNIFIEKVSKLTWATDEQISDSWVDCGADKKENSVTFAIADKHKIKYPQFARDTGAEILNLILDSDGFALDNQIDFLKDSLFCEWAYELNLDTELVTVYKGFQKKANGEYGPCKAVATIPFKEFTPKSMEQLEKSLCPDNE